MHNDQRNQRMVMANTAMGTAQYNMMRGMPNGVGGVAPNDLKRAAAMNNRGNPYVLPTWLLPPSSLLTRVLLRAIGTETKWQTCR
jgi:hypothetical protein